MRHIQVKKSWKGGRYVDELFRLSDYLETGNAVAYGTSSAYDAVDRINDGCYTLAEYVTRFPLGGRGGKAGWWRNGETALGWGHDVWREIFFPPSLHS